MLLTIIVIWILYWIWVRLDDNEVIKQSQKKADWRTITDEQRLKENKWKRKFEKLHPWVKC